MDVGNERVEELAKQFGKKVNDTGATEIQIAIFTKRITNITNHLKTNKKDNSSRRGLVILVSKRRKLLNYLQRTNSKSHKNVLEKLKIRK